MASTDSASNNKNQNLNNENIKNPEYKPKKIDSTLIYCKSNVNQNIFNSGFSEKNNINFNERFNSNHSIRSHPEYNFMNPFFIPSLKNFGAPLLSFAFSKNMNSIMNFIKKKKKKIILKTQIAIIIIMTKIIIIVKN